MSGKDQSNNNIWLEVKQPTTTNNSEQKQQEREYSQSI